MTSIRRLCFPLLLAWKRLLRRTGRVALLAIGLALGAGGLAVVLGGSLVAADRSLERALERLPPAEQAVHVAYFGLPPQGGDLSSLDRSVRRALRASGFADPIRALQYRQTRIGGRLVILRAIDGVGTWVRLTSGRLPRPCSSERCEVVRLSGSGRVASQKGLRLVPVGRGTLTSELPFGRLSSAALPVGPFEYLVRPAFPPVLLTEGVAASSHLPLLESRYRSFVWVVPLQPSGLHPWNVDAFEDAVTDVRAGLQAESIRFDVTAPVEELRSATNASDVARLRLLLLGGQGVALLLAFGVLVAGAVRRDLEGARLRLSWHGARPWQMASVVFAETGAVVVAATVVGWAAGAAVTLALSSAAGSPPGEVVRSSLISPTGLAAAAALAAVAALALVLSLGTIGLRLGGSRVTVLDALAAGALAAAALALARGEIDADSLSSEGGNAVLLLLLPTLVAFAAAVVFARLLVPALRTLERLVPRGASPIRLAALSLARRPGGPTIVVAFLVVSVAAGIFAGLYRSTLVHGQSDQADYAFPLDLIAREDLDISKLVSPLEAAPLAGYRVLAPGAEVVPVIRREGSISRIVGSDRVTLLGVPADSIPRLRGWRNGFSALPRSEIARRLSTGYTGDLRGSIIPRAARELILPVAAKGAYVGVTASVLTTRGDFVRIGLGETHGSERQVLAALLPARARGGRVVALTLGLTHADQETGGPVQGVFTLGRLGVGFPGESREISDYDGWIGVNGVTPARDATGVRLRFVVSNQVVSRFRPQQAGEGEPVPIAVTPRLAGAAGADGVLPVRIAGGQLVGRVVAVVDRFPSVFGDIVLADERTVFNRLNTESPGAAVPNEIWLRAPSPAAAEGLESALHRPPFKALDVSSRAALEATLHSDPLARGSMIALGVAALLALVLALVGLLLAVVAELRDERGELFDLEAEGASPRRLERHVLLRALILGGFGLAGGIAAGAILGRLVVALVSVTANAEVPEPPLVLAVDWPLLALGVLAYAVLVVALTGVAIRTAFPHDVPGRALGVET